MTLIILTHTAKRTGRQTQLSFTSEHEAQVMAYRMRRSPKTRAVALQHSVLSPAQWPTKQKPRSTFRDDPHAFTKGAYPWSIKALMPWAKEVMRYIITGGKS